MLWIIIQFRHLNWKFKVAFWGFMTTFPAFVLGMLAAWWFPAIKSYPFRWSVLGCLLAALASLLLGVYAHREWEKLPFTEKLLRWPGGLLIVGEAQSYCVRNTIREIGDQND